LCQLSSTESVIENMINLLQKFNIFIPAPHVTKGEWLGKQIDSFICQERSLWFQHCWAKKDQNRLKTHGTEWVQTRKVLGDHTTFLSFHMGCSAGKCTFVFLIFIHFFCVFCVLKWILKKGCLWRCGNALDQQQSFGKKVSYLPGTKHIFCLSWRGIRSRLQLSERLIQLFWWKLMQLWWTSLTR